MERWRLVKVDTKEKKCMEMRWKGGESVGEEWTVEVAYVCVRGVWKRLGEKGKGRIDKQ